MTTKKDKRESGDYQRAVGELVSREVIYCVSGLVFEIGKRDIEQWFHLFAQEDWETPAYEAIHALPQQKLEELLEENGIAIDSANTVQKLAAAYFQHLKDENDLRAYCEENDLEAQETEIFEHWIVSEWFAAKLKEKGEVIERDFYGLTIWGRACTGQAIAMDSVICEIYDDLHRPTIASLNDNFRNTFYVPKFGDPAVPGSFMLTHGISTLAPETQIEVWAAVANFKDFSENNDPHGEHDFGAIEMEGVGEKVFWKIDYYADKSCSAGAEDPADPEQSYRVLTIMLASEY